MTISAILVAGGIGQRMQSSTPKQYLELAGKPLACHSFDLLLQNPEITEIIVVCDPAYQSLFTGSKPIKFAKPGARRQDSVFNGFQEISPNSSLVCIHDSARPFLDKSTLEKALSSAKVHGASVVGVPLKFTIKESNLEGFVEKTPDRSRYWEIQTPQVIQPDLLRQGFAYAAKHNLTVTDDVALVELLNHPVRIVEGTHSNIKITTPEDLKFAEWLLTHDKI